jgi:hypothetical protein
MRPHERHTLDLIAHDIAAHDPELARQLSTPTLGVTARSRSLDLWIRRATITAIWLLGIVFGATLLGFGLVEHEEVSIALGAAVTAAITVAGAAIVYWRRHHLPVFPSSG